MIEEPPQLPSAIRMPRIFSIWGTICYGVTAVASITIFLLMAITNWTPPWYFIAPAFLWVFISTGIICFGRIESNRYAKFFVQALKARSEENKRIRKMN